MNYIKRLTILEFGELVSRSPRQLHRDISDKKLFPRRTAGGKPYFLDEDVKAYLQHTDGTKPFVCGESLDESN